MMKHRNWLDLQVAQRDSAHPCRKRSNKRAAMTVTCHEAFTIQAFFDASGRHDDSEVS